MRQSSTSNLMTLGFLVWLFSESECPGNFIFFFSSAPLP